MQRLQWLIDGFRNAVLDYNLSDIYLEGYQFTWAKGICSAAKVEERLDRAMVTSSWCDLFPEAKLVNLIASISDHSPILLTTENQPTHAFVPRRFKFENHWLLEDDIDQVVEHS